MPGLGIEKMEADEGMRIHHHAEMSPSTLHHEHKKSSSGGSSPTTPAFGDHGALIERISTDGAPPYRETGPTINRSKTADMKKPANGGLRWPRIRRMIREPLSEFMGTFILIMFGDGVVAQVVLSGGSHGDYQSISWGWGIGVMLGVYASGISGAHINPAVTFANCLFRKFPWKKFPIYASAQVLGAFCASGVVYANYKSAIDTFEGGSHLRTVPGYSENASAGIFCTYPADFMSRTGMFFSEFIASTLLMFMIYALKDDGNIGAGNLTPLGLFFIIFGIGACFGWETGYAINLARDFGPRLMSYFLGYGHEVWSAGGYYFWIPMIAPFFGCSFGGFLYDVLLFTGESPINTPYMGLYRFIPGMRHAYDGVSFNAEDLKEESAV
ncbi:glycerol channel [Elasticomyces elasticus]|nr:glycerol channel [Elasticomyces elasticus]KAK3662266.1 glycerol channel [Elasticomyces elasticus]KAK4924796.1 glycerol channel [Elasticomyces elasticus]KAK5766799.1 glycerol channel [Elasticomyces elasticus]